MNAGYAFNANFVIIGIFLICAHVFPKGRNASVCIHKQDMHVLSWKASHPRYPAVFHSVMSPHSITTQTENHIHTVTAHTSVNFTCTNKSRHPNQTYSARPSARPLIHGLTRAAHPEQVPGWVLPLPSGKTPKRRQTLPELFSKIQPQGFNVPRYRRPNPQVCLSSDEENDDEVRVSPPTADAMDVDALGASGRGGRRRTPGGDDPFGAGGVSDHVPNKDAKGTIPAARAAVPKPSRSKKSAKRREVRKHVLGVGTFGVNRRETMNGTSP